MHGAFRSGANLVRLLLFLLGPAYVGSLEPLGVHCLAALPALTIASPARPITVIRVS